MTRVQFAACLLTVALFSVLGSSLTVLILGNSVLHAEGDDQPAALVARSLAIVDDEGRQRLLLDVTEDGDTSIRLLTPDGKPGVTLNANNELSALQLHSGGDDDPHVLITTGTPPNGRMSAVLVRGTGSSAIGFHNHHVDGEEEGFYEESMFTIMGRNGNPRYFASHLHDETTSIGILDKDTNRRALLEAGDDSVALVMDTDTGNAVISLRAKDTEWIGSAHAEGMTSLQLKHEGVIRLGGVTRNDGRPVLRMFDRRQREVWAVDPQPDEND
jgi:hypothetical protein